ncbi:Uncharacterised protein [uncultured archaeon]|nr:Uncharacterised protein [uncultured archaeon]
MGFTELFSNILHKKNVRVANLEQIAGALKELNRKRVTVNATTGAELIFFVAPFSGFVEQVIVAAPGAETSGTVEVKNVTRSTTLATCDAAVTNLVADTGVPFNFAPAVSGGQALTQFEAGDVLSVLVTTITGPTTVQVAVTPNDKHFAI